MHFKNKRYIIAKKPEDFKLGTLISYSNFLGKVIKIDNDMITIHWYSNIPNKLPVSFSQIEKWQVRHCIDCIFGVLNVPIDSNLVCKKKLK